MIEIEKINTNKYFVGCMMIILTIGGRFIIEELSEKQRKRLDTTNFRKIFIFCAFFMATRDILIAFILTILFSLILTEIINGNESEDEEEDDIEKEIIVSTNLGAYI